MHVCNLCSLNPPENNFSYMYLVSQNSLCGLFWKRRQSRILSLNVQTRHKFENFCLYIHRIVPTVFDSESSEISSVYTVQYVHNCIFFTNEIEFNTGLTSLPSTL